MGIDLTSSSPSARCSLGVGSAISTNSFTTQSYGSTWVFDSTTVMSICADEDGNYGVNCVVQNLKVAYKIPSQFLNMPFSNTGNQEI